MANNFIRMFDGGLVDPFNLQPEDIRPVNFIHALSCINRYTGHLPFPISVAYHSYVLTEIVPDELKQCAYIHDWSEAFFNDLASPVKKRFPGYKAHEKTAQKIIFEVMGVDFSLMEEFEYFDKQIYIDESNAAWGDAARVNRGDNRVGLKAEGWFMEMPWRKVRNKYAEQGRKLFPGRID